MMPVKTGIVFEAGRSAASCGRDWAAIPKDFTAFATALSTAFATALSTAASTSLLSSSAVLGSTPLPASGPAEEISVMLGYWAQSGRTSRRFSGSAFLQHFEVRFVCVRRRLRLDRHPLSFTLNGLIAETTRLINKLKTQLRRCRPAFFEAVPDGRRHAGSKIRPLNLRIPPSAGDGPSSAQACVESVPGRTLADGILEALNIVKSESNRQRAPAPAKTRRTKTSACRGAAIRGWKFTPAFVGQAANRLAFRAICFGGAELPPAFPAPQARLFVWPIRPSWI